jgi:group I intron endonuclease
MIEEKENKYCVYIHMFPNKKCYIGITRIEPKRRWKSGCGYKRTPYIFNAIKKYGWDNIEHNILENGLTQKEASIKEKYYIKFYKSNEKDYGYNLTSGGEVGYEHNLEMRLKVGARSKGNKYSVGRKLSEQSKKKMSESAKKKVMSEEHIRKLYEYHNKPVNQYSLDGEFIARHESATIYARSIGKKNGHSVSQCCLKKRNHKTAYGYKWEYAQKEK